MSNDAINALEALRDAAFDPWACDWIKRAIAKLRAEQPAKPYCDHDVGFCWQEREGGPCVWRARHVEQPAPAKACAEFACDGHFSADGERILTYHASGSPWCKESPECVCRCGQPYSAHQPSEQPVSRLAKTVRREGKPEVATPTDADLDDLALATKVEVPPVPDLQSMTLHGHGDFDGEWIRLSEVRTLHAAAVALAERCETLQADFTAAMREATAARRAQGEAEGKLAASEMAGVVEGWKERCERAEAEATEWKLRAAKRGEELSQAERERDEARAQLAEAQVAGWLLEDRKAALRDARRQEREYVTRYVDEVLGLPTTARTIRALPEEVEK